MPPVSHNQLDQFSWETTASPSPQDAALVDQSLGAFNDTAARLEEVRVLACFAKSPTGTLVGGALARTWGRCCELQQIWVDEPMRRKGLGRRLVELVEREARARGCSLLYLETFSFQSPDFYRCLGFESACELAGFPNGIVKFVMRKSLA